MCLSRAEPSRADLSAPLAAQEERKVLLVIVICKVAKEKLHLWCLTVLCTLSPSFPLFVFILVLVARSACLLTSAQLSNRLRPTPTRVARVPHSLEPTKLSPFAIGFRCFRHRMEGICRTQAGQDKEGASRHAGFGRGSIQSRRGAEQEQAAHSSCPTLTTHHAHTTQHHEALPAG